MNDFQQYVDYHVYFNSQANDQERKEIKELIGETCKRIEQQNPHEIMMVLSEIEFIVYKPVEPDHAMDMRSSDGGAVHRTHCQRQFYIVYYPNPVTFTQRATKLYILAHEFAHVFHQHPLKELSADPQEYQAQRAQREFEADKKAIEWGFRPHDDDIVGDKLWR